MRSVSVILRFLCVICVLVSSPYSHGTREIDITSGTIAKLPIAVNFFEVFSAKDLEIAKHILSVVNQDLGNCGLFNIIPSAAFIEENVGVNHVPLFASWRQINAQLVLNGFVKRHGHRVEVGFILWDSILEKEIYSDIFELSEKIWRRAAHKISDVVYERVTGNKGYFDTRVAYISETLMPGRRQKRLAMMDYDGANHIYLSGDKNIVLTPRFSPKADKILYLEYEKRGVHIRVRDLYSNKDKLLGSFKGMAFAPKFSHDGTKVLMSIARNGSTNIVEFDTVRGQTRHLTQGYSINTSPSYSPDGQSVFFNSNRDGTRQLYVMDIYGRNVKRISFGSGAYATPVASPNGDYVAFTKQQRGRFYIGVMRPDGSGERILTSGYLVEGPTWSPSGNMIIFTRTEKPYGKIPSSSSIYMIDISGHNETLLPTPKGASDPEWSAQLE